MNCLLTKPITKQDTSLITQLVILQEDLARLSGFVTQLWGLTGEQLEAFEITDQCDAIHRALNRFEVSCLAFQIAACEDEFAAPVIEESSEMVFPENNNWTPLRREARRANKLAGQCTSTLRNICACLGENQNPGGIPEDIVRINPAVGNAVRSLASDWNPNLD